MAIQYTMSDEQASCVAIALKHYLDDMGAKGFKAEDCPAGSCIGQVFRALEEIKEGRHGNKNPKRGAIHIAHIDSSQKKKG